MKVKRILIIIAVVALGNIYGQGKYDKIFIDDTNVLIGEIKKETAETILFFDIELGENLTLFKNNLLKVVNKDGIINYYKTTESKTIDKTENEYGYGFYNLEIATEDPENMRDLVIEDFEEWSSRYFVIRILGKKPEFYWFQIKPGDLSTKSMLIRLPVNQYTIELYGWVSNVGVSTLISDFLKEKNPPSISERIDILAKNTTYHKVVQLIRDDSNILFTKWALKYETREKKESFIEKNYLQYKDVSVYENKVFHNANYFGTY